MVHAEAGTAPLRYHQAMLGPIRRWRRRRILSTRAFAEDLWQGVRADLPVLHRLDAEAERRLRDLALLFLAEKSLEPARGFRLDDAGRVRIAMLACRPILGLGLDCYDGFVSVIVHEDEFIVPDREVVDDAGVVTVGDDVLSGEAWEHGPIVLAWQEVLASGQGDGFDVVAHEFAHKLDLLDGIANGRPPLHASMSAAAWSAAFTEAYEDLCRRDARGEDTWLDPYAAEDPAEFFAVCTEMFFDVPDEFCRRYPGVYAQLAEFYRQEPARSRSA